jgi:hypothetical protein
MIAPYRNDSVFHEAGSLECGEHLAEHGVGLGDTGVVSTAESLHISSRQHRPWL